MQIYIGFEARVLLGWERGTCIIVEGLMALQSCKLAIGKANLVTSFAGFI